MGMDFPTSVRANLGRRRPFLIMWSGGVYPAGCPPVFFTTSNRTARHYDLELNNTYALLNKDVNTTIGSFIPYDLDDPERYAVTPTN